MYFLERGSPPSQEELDLASSVATVSFIVAAATIALVVVYSGYLMSRTKLPGRIEIFFGAASFAIFFMWTQFMGGYLEATLGPLGTLLNVILWSLSCAFFMFGHFRALRKLKTLER